MYRTKTAVAVLSALDMNQWRYINQIVERTLMHPGSITKTLRRFETAEMVESMPEDPAESDIFERANYRRRAPRKYYRLLAKGKDMLNEWSS